jgi:adenylate cyclase
MSEPNGTEHAGRGSDARHPERRSSARPSLRRGARLRWQLFALLLGALLQLLPAGMRLDELALPLLFGARGPLPPPPRIALVTLDEESAITLQLPDLDQLEQWPRTLYARLIRQLDTAGASVIAMDIAFLAAGNSDDDAELARALAEAGNVLLLKLLHRTSSGDGQQVTWQQLPLPLLRQHAEIATFTLPDQAREHQAALFITTPEGREATLPLAALLMHMRPARERLQELLIDIGESALAAQLLPLNSAHFGARLRAALLADSTLTSRLLQRAATLGPETHAALQHLLAVSRADSPTPINFYGPRHTIHTIPLHRVVQSPSSDERALLRDAIVFVGLSERIQKQRDYFFTAYSTRDEGRLSGVEVGATLTANLLHEQLLRRWPAPLQALLVAVWGGMLALALLTLPPHFGLPAFAVGVALYAGAALWLFADHALWLPVAVPLALLAPALLLLALWHHYRTSVAAEAATRETLALYIPADLAATVGQHRQALLNRRQRTEAVCLLTDIVGFTTFSEQRDPEVVHQLMNRYYREVVAAVERHGGSVANIVGDGLLALWPADVDGRDDAPRYRRQATRACAAAREIIAATDLLAAADATPLTTCVGLHCGSVSLGNLGAGSHYEYAPVGDTINTLSRVEACNRQFGSRILLTAAVRQWLDDAPLRDLGDVALKGKRQPLRLYELMTDEPAIAGEAMDRPAAAGKSPANHERIALVHSKHE